MSIALDVLSILTAAFTAVFLTVLIELPIVWYKMKYKSIKNIILINVFTNLLLSLTLLLIQTFEMSKYIYAVVLVLYELFLIPFLEITFYKKTNVFGIKDKTIRNITYLANFISVTVGYFITHIPTFADGRLYDKIEWFNVA